MTASTPTVRAVEKTATPGASIFVRDLTVLADSNQLQQALVNLALNARDALATRRPAPAPTALTFRLRRALFVGDWPAFPQNVPAGDYIVLEVIDEGCGMAPETMRRIFDPFFWTVLIA